MEKLKKITARHSQIKTQTVIFDWKIDNVDKIPYKNGYPIYSTPFTVRNKTDSMWQVLLIKDLKNVKINESAPLTNASLEIIPVDRPVPPNPLICVSNDLLISKENSVMKSALHALKTVAKSKSSLKDELKKAVTVSPSLSENSETPPIPEEDLAATSLSDADALKSASSVGESGMFEDQSSIGNSFNETDDKISDSNGNSFVEPFEVWTAVIGFLLIETSSGTRWENVERYNVTVKAGEFSAKASEMVDGKSKKKKFTKFKFVSDILHPDLFRETTINVIVELEYKHIVEDPMFPSIPTEQENIAKNFCNLSRKQHADIILTCGEEEILACKNLLCARSFHFDYLLQDHKLEKSVTELDVDLEIAQALLMFIYCGGIPVDFPVEKCQELYFVAKQYQVCNLDKICREFFLSSPEVCSNCLKDVLDLKNIDITEILAEKDLQKILSKSCHHAKQP